MTMTPPELLNTAEKMAMARAKRDELKDQLERLTKQFEDAQHKHYEAASLYDQSPNKIERAQNALTSALREGSPVTHLQAQIAAAQANVESFRQLRDDAEAMARHCRDTMAGPSAALAQAERDFEETEFLHLTAAIGKLAVEMRPLCARYRELAATRRLGLNDSGVLIDESHPNIGAYRLLPDGSLASQYFARIA